MEGQSDLETEKKIIAENFSWNVNLSADKTQTEKKQVDFVSKFPAK